jgi:hypothetical protein
VPNPYPEFENYTVFISPQKGLLKIVAIGRNIDANGFGEELHGRFIEIRDALAKTYGEPRTLDFVRSGSIWQPLEEGTDADCLLGFEAGDAEPYHAY